MADRSDATSAIRTSIFAFVVVAGDEDDDDDSDEDDEDDSDEDNSDEDDSDDDDDDDDDSDWDGAGSSSSGETDMIRSVEKRSANGAGRDRRRIIIYPVLFNLGQNNLDGRVGLGHGGWCSLECRILY
jgi:hypothetical protein